jgi:hypothetical protein
MVTLGTVCLGIPWLLFLASASAAPDLAYPPPTHLGTHSGPHNGHRLHHQSYLTTLLFILTVLDSASAIQEEYNRGPSSPGTHANPHAHAHNMPTDRPETENSGHNHQGKYDSREPRSTPPPLPWQAIPPPNNPVHSSTQQHVSPACLSSEEQQERFGYAASHHPPTHPLAPIISGTHTTLSSSRHPGRWTCVCGVCGVCGVWCVVCGVRCAVCGDSARAEARRQ